MNAVANGLWFGWIRINGKVKHFYKPQDSQKLLDASKEPNTLKQRRAAQEVHVEDKESRIEMDETLKNTVLDMIKNGNEVEVKIHKLTYYTYLDVKVKLLNKVLEEEE